MMKKLSHIAKMTVAAAVMAGFLMACGGPDARKQKSLTASQAFLEEGNLDKARIELRNVLQIDPNDAEARYLSGVVAERLENIRQAAGHYRGTLDIASDHVEARAALARIHVVAGLPNEAIEIVTESPSPVESSADLLAVRGAARAQLGAIDDALRDAEQSVALDANNERAIALYAGVLARLQQVPEAEAVLDSGIETLPESIDLRIARAVMAEEHVDLDLAESLYREVVELAPSRAMYVYQLAGYYERHEDIAAAEQVLRDSIGSVDDAPGLRARLVTFLESRVSPEAAEAELKKMQADSALASEAGIMLAAHYQRNGRLPEARAELEKVAAEDPRSANGETARSRLAVLMIRQGDRQAAVALLEEILEQNPRAFEALSARAGLALSENRPDDAIVDLRVMLRDRPDSAAIHQSVAQAHLLKGDYSLAEESLRNAVRAEPGNLDVRVKLAQFLAQTNEHEQAIDLIRTVVVSEPGNISARETAFRIFASTQQWSEALQWADSILAIDESSSLAYYLRGIALEGAADPDGALDAYSTAIELRPEFAEALAAWSRIMIRRGSTDQVVERLDKALAITPDNPAIGNLRGEVLLNAGRTDEARETLAQVIETSGGWWLPYRTLARSYVEAEPERAIEVLEKGLAEVAAPANIGIELATLYERLERVDDAIGVYEKMIAANRHSDLIANNLAMLLATYREDQESLARADELTRTFATSMNAAFLNTFGWVRLKSGEVETALPVLEKAVEMSPESAIMRYHLGIAHLENGSPDIARQHLVKALELESEFPGSDRVRDTLADIEPADAGQNT